jgi:hypothetical protein
MFHLLYLCAPWEQLNNIEPFSPSPGIEKRPSAACCGLIIFGRRTARITAQFDNGPRSPVRVRGLITALPWHREDTFEHAVDGRTAILQESAPLAHVPQFDPGKLAASSVEIANGMVYAQFYNFGVDPKTQKPDAEVEFEIPKAGIRFTEPASSFPGASGSQVTVRKSLPLKGLAPGPYELRLTVTGKIRNQTLTSSARFTVL